MSNGQKEKSQSGLKIPIKAGIWIGVPGIFVAGLWAAISWVFSISNTSSPSTPYFMSPSTPFFIIIGKFTLPGFFLGIIVVLLVIKWQGINQTSYLDTIFAGLTTWILSGGGVIFWMFLAWIYNQGLGDTGINAIIIGLMFAVPLLVPILIGSTLTVFSFKLMHRLED